MRWNSDSRVVANIKQCKYLLFFFSHGNCIKKNAVLLTILVTDGGHHNFQSAF